MYFAFELGLKRCPVSRDDVRQIKMLAPIRCNCRIDVAGNFIEDRFRIAVLS
jgi:hypothetical protein